MIYAWQFFYGAVVYYPRKIGVGSYLLWMRVVDVVLCFQCVLTVCNPSSPQIPLVINGYSLMLHIYLLRMSNLKARPHTSHVLWGSNACCMCYFYTSLINQTLQAFIVGLSFIIVYLFFNFNLIQSHLLVVGIFRKNILTLIFAKISCLNMIKGHPKMLTFSCISRACYALYTLTFFSVILGLWHERSETCFVRIDE